MSPNVVFLSISAAVFLRDFFSLIYPFLETLEKFIEIPAFLSINSPNTPISVKYAKSQSKELYHQIIRVYACYILKSTDTVVEKKNHLKNQGD